MKLILQAIKALFRKVENAIEDVRKSIPEVAQANWLQNDRTKPDYVKNRTHYEEVEQESIEGLEFEVSGFVSNSDNYTHELWPLELGQTWDCHYYNAGTGNWYKYVSLSVQQAEDGTLYIGTPTYDSVPFYITETEVTINHNWHSMSNVGGIKIAGVSGTVTETVIHKLDEKYLPDGVVEGIANAQATAETAQATAETAQATASNAQTAADNAISLTWKNVTLQASNITDANLLTLSDYDLSCHPNLSGKKFYNTGSLLLKQWFAEPYIASSCYGFKYGTKHSSTGGTNNAIIGRIRKLYSSGDRNSFQGYVIYDEKDKPWVVIAMKYIAGSNYLTVYLNYEDDYNKTTHFRYVDIDSNEKASLFSAYIEALADSVVLKSSTANSAKTFKLTVDDSGTITATEIT